MMMDDSLIFTAQLECSSCSGNGYSGGYGSVTSCTQCGGHGVIKEHITMKSLKDEVWSDMLYNITNPHNTSNPDFVETLLSNSQFVDKLLEKIGHRMEPDPDE